MNNFNKNNSRKLRLFVRLICIDYDDSLPEGHCRPDTGCEFWGKRVVVPNCRRCQDNDYAVWESDFLPSSSARCRNTFSFSGMLQEQSLECGSGQPNSEQVQWFALDAGWWDAENGSDSPRKRVKVLWFWQIKCVHLRTTCSKSYPNAQRTSPLLMVCSDRSRYHHRDDGRACSISIVGKLSIDGKDSAGWFVSWKRERRKAAKTGQKKVLFFTKLNYPVLQFSW